MSTDVTAPIEPSADYIRVETHVIVTCPDCGQTDCGHATAMAERLGKQIIEQRALEHSLATAFVELQDERNPEKRQKLWFECLRLGAEWKGLNGNETKHTNEPG